MSNALTVAVAGLGLTVNVSVKSGVLGVSDGVSLGVSAVGVGGSVVGEDVAVSVTVGVEVFVTCRALATAV